MTFFRDHEDEPMPVEHRASDLWPRCGFCDRPYPADAMTRLLDSRNRPSYRCTSCAESQMEARIRRGIQKSWCTTTAGRFSAMTVRSAGCWTWIGSRNGEGYGQLRVRGRLHYAHRYSYESHVGPIPAGLVIDHLCRNRGCVNPAHLEPVTNAENMARSGPFLQRRHCGRGHEMAGYNVYWYGTHRRQRACRACVGINNRAYYRRQRDRRLSEASS